MKNIITKELFTAAQRHSETLRSFTEDTLPQAGWQYIADMVEDGRLDGVIVLRLDDDWVPKFTASHAFGCRYRIFNDWSLLCDVPNAEGVVWADAVRFADENLLPVLRDGLPLDPEDWALVRFLYNFELPVQVEVFEVATGAECCSEVTLYGPVPEGENRAGDVLSPRHLAYLGLDPETVVRFNAVNY